MRTPVNLMLCSFLFLLAAISCSDDEGILIPLEEFFACHNNRSWNASEIEAELIGTWDWTYINCFFFPDQANGSEYEGLSVEFKSDNTVRVKQIGKPDQIAIWEIMSNSDGLFSLTTDPFITQIHGRILFCTNQLQFYDSYIDGCDNTFLKKPEIIT